MKSVFRKLAEWLGIHKETHEAADSPYTPTDRYRQSGELIKPEVEVRTKTVYPKNQFGPKNQPGGSFRFPLIPDHFPIQQPVYQDYVKKREAAPIRNTTPAKRVETSRVRQAEPANQPPEKPRRNIFKPSEMVSPVYGKMNKPQQGSLQTAAPALDKPASSDKSFKPSAVFAPIVSFPVTPGSLPNTDKTTSADETAQSAAVISKQPLEIVPVLHNPGPETSKQNITFSERPESASCQLNVSETAPARTEPVETASAAATDHANDHPLWSSLEKVRSSINGLSQSHSGYMLPSLNLLREEPVIQADNDRYIQSQIEKLTMALKNFNVLAEVVGVVKGPTVTRYELQPAPGVKVNKFTNLIDDIKLALAAKDIRMEAPIPGRSAIGIEVPNEVSSPVFIRSILESEEFRSHPSPLAVALGRDIGGAPVIGDLKKMPHGLIAGSTGSGKSVCINSILVSLMFKAKPSEVRLILIDPKVVELAPYNHIPHLLTPVVTDPKQATAALKWAVQEMETRYEKFADLGVRDIDRFNAAAQKEGLEKLPYIVIVIDELADLMMVSPHDVEESICRIAQKARACGIHLLVATQRPSVDVITGLIKANIPTRIAFAVSSQADSRTILDMGGAERLLGKGDMLYYPSGLAKPVRLQGNFVSDEEIEQVVEHAKRQQKVQYLFDKAELGRSSQQGTENEDELFAEALLFVIEQGQASASSLQRRFRIGYNRAARLVDMMESEGFISGQSGSKPREVLLSLEEYERIFG